jgi:hypothetical protein
VLQKLVTAYNDTVRSATGMAPTKINDTNILKIWKRIDKKNIKKQHVVQPKYKIGQYVRISKEKMRFRISKEKMRFAKESEQNYSTEIFRIRKVIERRLRPVYELHDFNDTPIDG